MPTAAHVLLRSREEALTPRSPRTAYPTVLKADGLAAGKGVILCADEAEARERARRLLHRAALRRDRRSCWRSSSRARSSRCWRSATARTSCRSRPAQDYKRIFDGDEGPNTGGMGSYSPVPGLRPRPRSRRSSSACTARSSRRWRARGAPFHGVLYAGLMIGADGPKVLEFNARFGDPETQAVLPRLRSDLVDLFLAAREPGGLAGVEAEFDDDWAVTVVLASAGYPESSSQGRRDPRPRGGGRARRGHPRRHRRARRRDRHRRRPRPQRDRARRRARPRRAIARTMRRAGSPSRECRSAPTSPPAPSSGSPASPPREEDDRDLRDPTPTPPPDPAPADPPSRRCRGRGGLRGDRGRRRRWSGSSWARRTT